MKMSLGDIIHKRFATLTLWTRSIQWPHIKWPDFRHVTEIPLFFALVVLLIALFARPGKLETGVIDAALSVRRPVPAHSVRLVVIDDDDYADKDVFQGRSPLNPEKLSALLAAIARAHPSAIVVDIDTTDPSFKDVKQPPVPVVWNVGGTPHLDGAGAGKPPKQSFVVSAPLGGATLRSGSRPALAFANLDDRGVVRDYRRTYPRTPDGLIPSPDYAVAEILAGDSRVKLSAPGENQRLFDFHYQFVPIKAGALLQDAKSESWESMSLFRNQVVVLGGTYRAARDSYTTPRGTLFGCELVAQAVEAELDGTTIAYSSQRKIFLPLVLGGLVILLLSVAIRSIPSKGAASPTTAAGLVFCKFKRLALRLFVYAPFVLIFSLWSGWILFHSLAPGIDLFPAVAVVLCIEIYATAEFVDGWLEIVDKVKLFRQEPRDIAGHS
jgi:CHASE2 domain-containing sensor protein